MNLLRRLLPLLLLTTALPLLAQPPAEDLPTRTLETVVVSGEQPGPGLWRVVGDDGHVMWVLASLVPLPKRMAWTAREVEARVAESERVLLPPSVEFDVKAGFFGRLALIPAAMRARNNPGKAPLQDVVPADLYARWQVLKQRYIGRSRAIEKRRPIVAAQKLLEEALDDHDLSWKNVAAERVRKTAKKHGRELHAPGVEVSIDDPKALLADFNAASLSDLDCFEKTLERLESDIEPMKLRANAWAVGAVEYLRSLDYTRSYRACADALLETEVAKKHGFADLEQRLRTAWLADAEQTLGKHRQSFALLPMSLVVGSEGYLAELGRRGYRIEAPDAVEDADADGSDTAAEVEGGGSAAAAPLSAAAAATAGRSLPATATRPGQSGNAPSTSD